MCGSIAWSHPVSPYRALHIFAMSQHPLFGSGYRIDLDDLLIGIFKYPRVGSLLAHLSGPFKCAELVGGFRRALSNAGDVAKLDIRWRPDSRIGFWPHRSKTEKPLIARWPIDHIPCGAEVNEAVSGFVVVAKEAEENAPMASRYQNCPIHHLIILPQHMPEAQLSAERTIKSRQAGI